MVGWRAQTMTSWWASTSWRGSSRTRQELFVSTDTVLWLAINKLKSGKHFPTEHQYIRPYILLALGYCSVVTRVEIELENIYKHPDFKCQTFQNEQNCLNCLTSNSVPVLVDIFI